VTQGAKGESLPGGGSSSPSPAGVSGGTASQRRFPLTFPCYTLVETERGRDMNTGFKARGIGPDRKSLPSHRLSRKRVGKVTLRNTLNALIFISPWLAGFSIFTVYPVVASAYWSFTQYSAMKPPKWIGLSNYTYLLTKDHLFYTALRNTLYYATFFIPLSTVLAIGLAVLLNMKLRGISGYRTLFYVPSIVPLVSSAILWMWILNPQYGLANVILRGLGLPALGWLSSPTWSKPGLLLFGLWAGIGNPMLIYLAGLQGISETLYEAADLDGANGLQKLWHVTLPLLTPVMFFNLVTIFIATFQYFTEAYVMTGSPEWGGVPGGPMDSTTFYMLVLYNNAFKYFKLGYASAMAWMLLILVLVLTLLLFWSSKKWVHYGEMEA
jgi:multiple sugar transport system permease protein